MPRKKVPKPPVGLSTEAMEHWREVALLLEGNTMLDNPSVMSMYAEIYAQWKEATKKLAEIGVVIRNKSGDPIESPYKKAAKTAQNDLTDLLRKFGGVKTTPVSVLHLKKKKKAGRPTSYKPEYVEEMLKWFDIPLGTKEQHTQKNGVVKVVFTANDLPTLNNFACHIGTTTQTMWEWANLKDDNGELEFPLFADAYKRAKEHQERILVGNTLNGSYNAFFASFTAKNILRWTDRQQMDMTMQEAKKITEDMSPEEAAEIYLGDLNNRAR